MPSIKKILSYWQQKQDSGDWELREIIENEPHCFACGAVEGNLDRAHIIPKSLGGSNDSSNLLLLCKSCHRECPDIADRESVISWVNNRESQVTRTMNWVMEAVKESGITSQDLSTMKCPNVKESLMEFSKIAGSHFGIGMKASTHIATLALWLRQQRDMQVSESV